MPPSIDKSVDDVQEVYIKNPTYEGRPDGEQVTDEVTDEVTYDTVKLPGRTELENDNTYAVPDQDWQGDGTYIF